jgi:hypothetical protein
VVKSAKNPYLAYNLRYDKTPLSDRNDRGFKTSRIQHSRSVYLHVAVLGFYVLCVCEKGIKFNTRTKVFRLICIAGVHLGKNRYEILYLHVQLMKCTLVHTTEWLWTYKSIFINVTSYLVQTSYLGTKCILLTQEQNINSDAKLRSKAQNV